MGKNCHPSFVVIQCRGLIGKVSDAQVHVTTRDSRDQRCCPEDFIRVLFLRKLSLSRGVSCSLFTASNGWDPMSVCLRCHATTNIDPDLEEFVGVGGKSTSSFDQPKSLKITLKKKSAPSSSDCHETNQLLIGPPSSDSSAAPVPSKSFEKRPIDEVETEVPGNTLATDHERDPHRYVHSFVGRLIYRRCSTCCSSQCRKNPA
nr:hypothetical protein Iba_chr02bCG9160 [Ipomoea batatas]